jgi:hypothetical protein
MAKWGKLNRDNTDIKREVRLGAGRLVSVGGIQAAYFDDQYMIDNRWVPFVEPVVGEFEQSNSIYVINFEDETPVSYTYYVSTKLAATQRAYLEETLVNKAQSLIIDNNNAIAKESAKEYFNDNVADKYKSLVDLLAVTSDQDLSTFDYTSIWDQPDDFPNPGISAAVWARLLNFLPWA